MKNMKPTKAVMTLVGLAIIGWGIFEGISLLVDHHSNETSDSAQIEQYISPIHVRARATSIKSVSPNIST